MDAPFDLDPAAWARLRRLLDVALQQPPGQRQAWIAGLPAEDAALAPRLNALLAHAPALHGATDGSPADAESPAAVAARLLQTLPRMETGQFAGRPPTALPAEQVGPYRLLHELGHGGMASVWLAERTDVLQGRRAAIKLPLGAWHGAGLAERLARERAILATLNHPHIATLYDAGVDDAGRPWLALEYVEGERIDAYCARLKLGISARLELMVQVAQAVAHAHANLVVHRDLKPANILVTTAGQVKLLDFGIAKLLEQDLLAVEAGALTQQAGRALTPDYAAPEQILGRPVGTAADVYALGVVLYELLAGVRPYTLQRGALEAAIARVQPPPPSSAAAARGAAWQRALRGDLDTIVARAMRHDPIERYATVAALADDLQRHLAGQPVAAQPDRLGYRLRKFVARHRLGTAAGVALTASVLAGAGLALWQAQQARAERAHAEQVKDFIAAMLREASPYHRADRPAVTALDLVKSAEKRLAQAVGQRGEVHAELAAVIIESLMTLGDNEAAAAATERALAQARRTLGEGHVKTSHLRAQHAQLLRLRGQDAQSQAELSTLLPALRQKGRQAPDALVTALQVQVLLHIQQGKPAEAVAVAEEAARESSARLGDRHSDTVACASLLTQALVSGRQLDAAVASGRRALALALGLYGETEVHPRVMEARNALGRALAAAGPLTEGVALIERSAADAGVVLGPESVLVGYYLQNAVDPLITLGEVERALADAERGLAIIEKQVPKASFAYGYSIGMRGQAQLAAGRHAQALPDLEAGGRVLADQLGFTHERTLLLRAGRALALADLGRRAEARDEAQAVLQAVQDPAATPMQRLRGHAVMARVERLDGQPQAAVALLLPHRAPVEGPSNERREHAHLLAELGQAQLALGLHAVAEQTLQQAVQVFGSLQSRPTPAHDEAQAALARARDRKVS